MRAGCLSLPSRERGLKFLAVAESGAGGMSLPSRERGLKSFTAQNMDAESRSLPSRERGLKLVRRRDELKAIRVAPFTGAWIEIIYEA